LIRKIKVCTASEHDTLHLENVLDPCNTSRDAYADKGYVNGKREARLKGEGWRMHIQRKGSKDNPLSAAQERRKSGATAASPSRALASSMSLPAWRNWAARCCARSAWHAPRYI
jgi:IS5 family transposase